MEDSIEIKDDLTNSDFDAFTDGTTVHRRYRLRAPKPKQAIKESPGNKAIKNEFRYDDDPTYDCEKCSKKFDSKTGLLNHLRMHNIIRKFTCALCEKVFETNEKLIKHKAVHNDEDRIFVCKSCKLAFTDHCDFMIHDISHIKQSTYKCAECAMYFKPKSIGIHIQSHYDRKLKCNVCSKILKGKGSLSGHMRLHDPANIIECGECGKIYKEKAQLNYHMMSHTGVKSIQCYYCGMGFFTSQQRNTHMLRKHTTDRPHKCSICDSKFKTDGDLKYHMNTHKKEKDLECEICSKKFYLKQSLQYHMRTHTKVDAFDCPECDQMCPSRQALRTHMIYKHTNTRDFKCGLCDLSFKTLVAITRHNKSKMHLRAEYGMKKEKTED